LWWCQLPREAWGTKYQTDALQAWDVHAEETSIEQAEIQLKYCRYLEKEEEMALRMSKLENLLIPGHINYDQIPALSNEALQKFKKIQPQTLGQASRISGVNPSDVQILMVYMGR
jgi:tRNA uridine 5-carboxymethylaminomethyl modification enzyme